MIDLAPHHLEKIRTILGKHVPECEVRAFGSRVDWTAKDYSDLDLAVVASGKLSDDTLRHLREAFEESDLPFRVEVLDWHAISPDFQKVIEKEYEVIQGSKSKNAGGELREFSLGDLIEIVHGYAFQGDYFCGEPVDDILLTPGNFAVGGGFKSDKFKYYRGPVPEEFVLVEGDLLVTMTDLSKAADTLGFPALIPSPPKNGRFLHNQRLGKVIMKPGAPIEKRFLYYVLCGRDYRNEVIASATGTTVKHTSPTRIKNYKFLLPPEGEQCAIAHILGTLDDKIELNRRMNETLEAMAQALFKSWFVDFDPVRAKAEGRDPGLLKNMADLFPDSFEESEVKEIPKGWRIRPLPEAIQVNTPRTMARGKVAPYLDMANIPTRGHSPDVVMQRAFSSGTRFINGDTLVARITPCLENGKAAYVDFLREGEVGWGSTEFIVLRPRPPLPTEYAYCLARSEEFRDFAIQSMTGSSGRQRVPPDSLSHFVVATPSTEVAAEFGGLAKPLFALARAGVEESRVLAHLRDTLLPKLVSGEVRVSIANTHSRLT